MTAGDQQDTELARALVATGTEDRAAFARLYQLASAKLFGICLRICGDRQAAEDVLQEVFVTIWKRAGAFDPGRGGALAWLAAIARNRAIDQRRAAGKHRGASADRVPEPVDPAPTAAQALLLDEEGRRLQACLEGLSVDQRDAIRTAFFDGVTYAELAGRSGVPEGTMKSRVRRGLLRLRDCLDGDA